MAEDCGPDPPAGLAWYAGGLRFACTRCGRCCTGTSGYVWTSEEEIGRLAEALSLPVDEFGRRYLRRVGSRYALLEHPLGGDCVLLRDGLCSVYEARPAQCRAFPFWPRNLESAAAWRAAAEDCEGIVLDGTAADAQGVAVLAAEQIEGLLGASRSPSRGPRSIRLRRSRRMLQLLYILALLAWLAFVHVQFRLGDRPVNIGWYALMAGLGTFECAKGFFSLSGSLPATFVALGAGLFAASCVLVPRSRVASASSAVGAGIDDEELAVEGS